MAAKISDAPALDVLRQMGPQIGQGTLIKVVIQAGHGILWNTKNQPGL
ncbi:hypothetical protein Q1W73_15650 [Asticcacaulis sp. ZE23SCel15]|nr:hypothetical protein [Asticcacaulis sp. ZE23SCel15]WKL57079.1 hypothetical protein Q1W73_15650 [Asticcacaulis sp. ZE23SCel15]